MNNAPNKSQHTKEFVFTDSNLQTASKIVAKYPAGRQASALLPLLDLAQRQHNGWLPHAALDYVANFLGIPEVRVYEVATFYTMFNLNPIGRHHVQVCTNLSCWLRGSDDIVQACERNLGVGMGGTSDDRLFTLSEVECLCACVNAPIIQIDDDYYEDLSPESVDLILNQFRSGKKPKPGSQIGRKSSEPASGLTTLTSMHWADAGDSKCESGDT